MSRIVLIVWLVGLLPTVAAFPDQPPDEGRREVVAADASPTTADWNQFRGSDGSGVSPETGLLRSWPEEGPKELWRKTIGAGFSGVSAHGKYFYLGFADGDAEFLGGFRVADGAEVWRLSLGEPYQDQFVRGPRATPSVDDDAAYLLGSRGMLVAADAETGKLIWEVNLLDKYAFYGPQMTANGPVPRGPTPLIPAFGYSCSPLVEGDLIVFEAGTGEGKSWVALDKRTGELRWTALDYAGIGYSSPMAATIGGQRQILLYTPSELVSLLPSTGQIYWRHPFALTVAQPVFLPPDKILLSTSDFSGLGTPDVETRVVKVGGADGKPVVEPLWEGRILRNHWSSSLVYKGYIYGFDNATMKCIDVDTGDLLWAKRGLGKASLVAADDLLIVWGDRGKLTLVDASPEGYRQKGQVQILEEGQTWTPPTIAGGKLYLRGNTDVVCLDIKG